MGAWRRVGTIALVALATKVAPAWGDAEPEPILVRLVAPQGCANEAAFIRALRQRTERFRLASQVEQARLFLVTITPAQAFVAGRLEIHGPGLQVSLREVTGKTCDGVLAALAFMTALAVDPSAASAPSVPTVPSDATSGEPPPSNPAPTAASPAVDSRAASANRATRAPAVEAPPPPRSASPAAGAKPSLSSVAERRAAKPMPSEPEPPETAEALPPVVAVRLATPESMAWEWSAGAHGGASLHMSPTTGWGGLVFVEAAAPGTAWFGPVLRTGLFLNQSDASLASGAEARFQWATALLEGCPLRLAALDARLLFHSCLAFHMGVLRGQGQRLDRPERTTDLWADLGPLARIRVAIAARLFLEAQGMLVLPLRRLVYDVYDAGSAQPPTTIFAVPRLGALLGIGVAYRFR
jgi:hypothetical protein